MVVFLAVVRAVVHAVFLAILSECHLIEVPLALSSQGDLWVYREVVLLIFGLDPLLRGEQSYFVFCLHFVLGDICLLEVLIQMVQTVLG